MLWQKDELLAKDLKYRLFYKKEPFNKVITSERKIAKYYNLSRNTVRKALNVLINEKVISLNNGKYQINQNNEDIILSTIQKKQLNKNFIFTNINKKNIEANKVLASMLNIALGDSVTRIQYLISSKCNRIVPFEFNTIYFCKDSFTFLPDTSHITPLDRILNSTMIINLNEKQHIQLEHPSQTCQFYLQLSVDDYIIRRTSLFSSRKIRFILKSEILPDWTKICNPNFQIEQKVDGFIE